MHLGVNLVVPRRPHRGHFSVENVNNKKSVKNWSWNFEVQIYGFAINIFWEKKFLTWSYTTIKIPMSKTQNTANT